MVEAYSRRSVKLNIPDFIDDYQSSYKSGEISECEDLKNYFFRVYDKLSDEVKAKFVSYIERYMSSNDIDHKRDLGLVFGDLIKK